jgi:hypothetical protein
MAVGCRPFGVNKLKTFIIIWLNRKAAHGTLIALNDRQPKAGKRTYFENIRQDNGGKRK